jgi:hypothetical protein
MRMTLQRLWFYPPLAFARIGTSDTPLQCFSWGPDDDTPGGTGKTTILPGVTLRVTDDGGLAAEEPGTVLFKDSAGLRPVCPFFELHAAWSDDGGAVHEGPVTEALLRAFGLSPHDLTWDVAVANHKVSNVSQDPDARVEASVSIAGDDTAPHELRGTAPADARVPLVPPGQFIPLGSVRLTRPNAAFPELRLRFTPPKGKFYGPSDLRERLAGPHAGEWRNAQVDDASLVLNPNSPWCRWTLTFDPHSTPSGQYAQDDLGVSLGLIDDVSDGLIVCRVASRDGSAELAARARIVVAPPDYAPDRRHPTSLADGLKDRVDRAQVFDDAYYADPACDAEIQELMERIFETASLNNVDALNDRVNHGENEQIALHLGLPFRPMQYVAFPPRDPLDRRPLPLTDAATAMHRRFAVPAAFVDAIRAQPQLLRRYVREPLDPNPFYDARMPAVMCGSSGDPLSLTRRQYEFLMRWAARLVTDDAQETLP